MMMDKSSQWSKMKRMKKIKSNGDDPKATSRTSFYRLLDFLKPTKKDIFYDLGCGYGNLCLWISPLVKCAIGIENYTPYYDEAVRRTLSCKYPNIKIIKQNFEKTFLNDATIIYSTNLELTDFIGMKNRVKDGTCIIVPILPPPYPIKSKKVGSFFIMKTPFERVRDENEFACICVGRNDVTAEQMYSWMKHHFERSVESNTRWQIQRGNSLWNRMCRK